MKTAFSFRNKYDQKMFRKIVTIVPKKTRIYLYGGVVRNAFYYRLFGKWLPQRDCDLIVIGDYKQFIKNLKSIGFVRNKKSRVAGKLVLKKSMVNKPRRYKDYFWLDMVLRDSGSVLSFLKKRVNFTINGFALSLDKALQDNWQKHVIALPYTFSDIKKKKLRTWVIHPIDIYATIRFVSLDFVPPTKREIDRLLNALRNIERWRFNRDTKKVVEYVGSKKKVRQIAKNMGIKIDVFDFKSVTK